MNSSIKTKIFSSYKFDLIIFIQLLMQIQILLKKSWLFHFTWRICLTAGRTTKTKSLFYISYFFERNTWSSKNYDISLKLVKKNKPLKEYVNLWKQSKKFFVFTTFPAIVYVMLKTTTSWTETWSWWSGSALLLD